MSERIRRSRNSKDVRSRNIEMKKTNGRLEEGREEEKVPTRGYVRPEVSSESLFWTDTGGFNKNKNVARSASHGSLRADDTLRARSKAPRIKTRVIPSATHTDMYKLSDGTLIKRKREHKIPYSELKHLREVALGREASDQATAISHNDVVEDIWAGETWNKTPSLKPSNSQPPIRRPNTLDKPPSSLVATSKQLPSVPVPFGHKSYNPVFSEWSDNFEVEKRKALEAEQARIGEAEADKLKAARLVATAEEADRHAREAEILSDFESEREDSRRESDPESFRLSTRKLQRKTPAQRNKWLRRKEVQRWQKHEQRSAAATKRRSHYVSPEGDASSSKTVVKSFQTESAYPDDHEGTSGEIKLRRRFPGKRSMPGLSMELVLPDELEDSLRRLRPEGNLLSDRYRSALLSGKTEVRKRPSQRKKPRREVMRKWADKDWKLNTSLS